MATQTDMTYLDTTDQEFENQQRNIIEKSNNNSNNDVVNYNKDLENIIKRYPRFYDKYGKMWARMSDEEFYHELDENNEYCLREFYVRNMFVFFPHNFTIEIIDDGKYEKTIYCTYKWGLEIRTIENSLYQYNLNIDNHKADPRKDKYTCLSLITGKENNIICIDIDDRSKCDPKLIDLLNKECKWIEVSGSSISDKLEKANKLHYFFQYDEELNHYHDSALDILTDRHL